MAVRGVKTGCVALILVAGCETLAPTPKPSMWALENRCAETYAVSNIENCTRAELNATYGESWTNAPQAEEFVRFIEMTAEQVRKGALTEAEGKYQISAFASRQSSAVQAQRSAQSAAMTNLGLAMMAGAAQQPSAVGSGYSMRAGLISQRTGVSVTGQSLMVCVYQAAGTPFERYLPVGSVCPTTTPVQ